ncbi:MAG: prephenate/arogenate dehydrogenase family protein [Rhodobiaceae bacterium]|nr:prephenate/arogenate dehydrogenase family protein [Rhodobiaceae bacterium]
MSEPVFKTLTLVGIGLIGSSIALAARRYGLVETIVVCDADEAALKRAEQLGLGDRYETDAASAVRDADGVILCVPVGAIAGVVAKIAPALQRGAVVSDTGSVKVAPQRDFEAMLPVGVHGIPGHPVAGTEQSGPDAGFATLFRDRWFIITPSPGTDEAALARLVAFWRGMGSAVEIMDAEHHDRVLAITSHLPHLIAYNIVGTVAELEGDTKTEVIKFSASGFRDFTRLAASDPTMWRDVFLNNREAVLEMLGRFTEDLTALQKAIRKGDGAALFDRFTQTRNIRRGIIDAGQEVDVPDFGRHVGEE